MKESPDQLVKIASAFTETLNLPHGTAANHLLGHKLRLPVLYSCAYTSGDRLCKKVLEVIQDEPRFRSGTTASKIFVYGSRIASNLEANS